MNSAGRNLKTWRRRSLRPKRSKRDLQKKDFGMRALVLAAGYGTRLYPLTKNIPKSLLPIDERMILDFIIKKFDKLKATTEIILVTNEKFFGVFQDWKD